MRRYTEDWERKKSYLIRSLFQDVPLLSPVPEYSDDSLHLPSPIEYRPNSPLLPGSTMPIAYHPNSPLPPHPPSSIEHRPDSPLPPLIIEREPNRHDYPKEFYQALAVKIRRIYEKMFIGGSGFNDSDDLDVVYEENCDTMEQVLEEEVIDSGNTEDTSGSHYRQITTQAEIHVDGTQVEMQSCISEGSARSIILTLRDLWRVEAEERGEVSAVAATERVGSDEPMTEEEEEEEESVMLEDHDDPEDADLPYNDPEDKEAEVSNDVEDIEVIRTPLPKISVDSIVHVTHDQSDITGEYSITHHASAMTSESDITKPTSPGLNKGNETIDKYRKRKSGDTVALGHGVSPILNVGRSRKRIVEESTFPPSKESTEELTSDMNMTSPVCHFYDTTSFSNKVITGKNLDGDSRERTSNTHVRATELHLNVTFLNEGKDNENVNTKRRAKEITSDTQVASFDSLISNEDVNMDEGVHTEGITDTQSFLNKNRFRKRRAEVVSVQTATRRVDWEDLKKNLFVGTPKIFRLCACSDHACD